MLRVALGRRLRRFAESVPGREQLAIEAWADALESIPRALAANAGFDGIDSLLKLTAAHSESGDHMGLDLSDGMAKDTISRGVLEPMSITRQAISGATEAAISILRIDDVLWAQMDAQVDMQKAQMRQSLEERRLAQQKEIAAAKIQADLLKSRN